MGLVLRGSDLRPQIMEALSKLNGDGLLSDGDVICITESIVARAQNNYTTVEEAGRRFRKKLSLPENGRVGVLFPIVSRNRFSLILESIASAVPRGEVVIQLSYPHDEVGNQIIPPEAADALETAKGGRIFPEKLDRRYLHPLTGIDYTQLYSDIVRRTGASVRLFLCNDPGEILMSRPDAVIAADIHTREKTRSALSRHIENVITLQDLFNEPEGDGAWSEWGLLGSNMASGNRLKLAPRKGDEFVRSIQKAAAVELGKNVEVIIYGDGAYKDPTSGIYELADPCAAFGATPGLRNVLRSGIKLKYMVDLYQEQGVSEAEIQRIINEESQKEREADSDESEGTTPRRMQDILASLADLVSGSADAGTPVVLARGFMRRGDR